MRTVDLIVIGGGPGGYEIAAEQAALGLSVVLFESGELGGTCLNRGCIPTKCLAAAAKRLSDLRTAADFGITLEGFHADYGAAVRRASEVMGRLRADIAGSLKDVELVRARARLGAGRTVEADGESYSARRIIIATGSRPAALPIEGADLCLDSDDFLRLDSLPQRVAIVGGGVIGLEFASILAAYGSEVTVVEFCKEILPAFDADIAKRLRSLLGRRGVKFVLGAAVKSVESGFALTYEDRKGLRRIEGLDAVLCCVGRRPVVPEGCAEAGVELDSRGFIKVDPSTMATTAEGIYAVGDVNGLCMLAHAASAQARVAVGESVDLALVPSVVFTDPECAATGLGEDACARAAMECAVSKALYSSNGKAEAAGEGEGLVKIVYEPNSRRLLGCSAVGAHAADIVAEATVAIAAGLGTEDLARRIIHAHPTLSELLASAAAAAR